MKRQFSWRMLVLLGTALMATGCDSASSTTTAPSVEATTSAAPAESHDHNGWWCVEHGVPEAECALCDVSLVANFKAKGDWCDEHNRPESQCFVCDPSRFEAFAARYEAKLGERPPSPTE
jgi:hypothetical protein